MHLSGSAEATALLIIHVTSLIFTKSYENHSAKRPWARPLAEIGSLFGFPPVPLS
jgi:hypothetical protein